MKKSLISMILLSVVLWFSPATAHAHEGRDYSERLNRLAQISNMQSDIDELERQVQIASQETGYAPIHVIDMAISASLEASRMEKDYKKGSAKNLQSFVLGAAHNAGDIFYTPANTSGWNHGHTGIYSTRTLIVEAPGPFKVSHEVPANSVRVSSGSQIMEVKTGAANRNAAAARSKKYVGRQYQPSLINRHERGTMNCSQLVWAAYKYSVGIDLDPSPNDVTVLPIDIVNSSWTTTYMYM